MKAEVKILSSEKTYPTTLCRDNLLLSKKGNFNIVSKKDVTTRARTRDPEKQSKTN